MKMIPMEIDKDKMVAYFREQLELIDKMPEKFYDINNKNWAHQGGAMSKETKEKVRYNINLAIRQLENVKV